mmetsp:Transcript_30975/g.39933  ORF Transcript_30975/g.39933 Transcript_30975/m.39933 type:complete len:89 (+) Transcript_30975:199-465(+)
MFNFFFDFHFSFDCVVFLLLIAQWNIFIEFSQTLRMCTIQNSTLLGFNSSIRLLSKRAPQNLGSICMKVQPRNISTELISLLQPGDSQ